jgi:hypothetical protein
MRRERIGTVSSTSFVTMALPEINDKMYILICIQSMCNGFQFLIGNIIRRKYLARNYGNLRARLLFADLVKNKAFICQCFGGIFI